ncbi:MAG: sigma-54-dependent Fis family transcriptional regulator [Planctomycetes bacterium]|nr:sigma-54-dependent Fis family transcriptional regulator [Planctomycetota bacterium]
MKPILIVEDEAAIAAALAILAQRLGRRAVTAPSATLGLQALEADPPALVLLDIGLPDASGLEALARIRARDAALPVLVITAHGNLQNAVEAKKRGASGYLVKPLDLRELERTMRALLLVADDGAAGGAIGGAAGAARAGAMPHAPLLIGSSPAMQPAFAAIAHACAADVPVLLTGPTGIGKSLCARVIHLHSARQAGPFVTLACASLPDALLEAELFGHEKGSFTGAEGRRIGHLERAAGGTLFLDEVAEIPPPLQVKLLRFVEEKTFVRVGGREDVRVDLRIVAATNQDLVAAIAERRFREDLYYRLRVLEVKLPPLCERLGDLPTLCAYLLAACGGNRPLSLSAAALAVLRRHAWPGNVRELRNVLEHAAAVCSGPVILEDHLPAELLRAAGGAGPAPQQALDAALHEWLETRLPAGVTYDQLHDELEGRLLGALLPRHHGKPTLLARALDMNRATLRRKLRALLGASDDGDDEPTAG